MFVEKGRAMLVNKTKDNRLIVTLNKSLYTRLLVLRNFFSSKELARIAAGDTGFFKHFLGASYYNGTG